MKTSENLSAEQSLDLITSMIQQAKGNVKKNSFHFLLWGWVVVIANLSVYVLLNFTSYPHPYFVWLITIPAAIVSTIYGIRQGRNSSVATHIDRVNTFLWIGFGVACFTFIIFGSKIGWQINPVIITVCALPTLTSGVSLRFKPLMYGALALWAMGCASFLVEPNVQPLLSAAGIALGYLVPGYMLKSHEG